MKHIVFASLLLISQLTWAMDEEAVPLEDALQFVYSDDADGRTHEPSKLYTERKHSGKMLHEREVTTIGPNTYFIKPYQAGHYQTQQVADARDRALLITNLKTKKVLLLHDKRANLHYNNPSCIAFNADGSLVAAGYKTRGDSWPDVVLWNITQKVIEEVLLLSDCREVTALAFAPQGRDFVAGYDNGTIMWSNNKPCLGHHAKAVLALAYNRLGQLASLSEDSTIKIWDAEKHENTQTITLDAEHDIIGFYPDSSTLFSCDSHETDKISFYRINS